VTGVGVCLRLDCAVGEDVGEIVGVAVGENVGAAVGENVSGTVIGEIVGNAIGSRPGILGAGVMARDLPTVDSVEASSASMSV
jgi:hypothetical protein